MVPALSTMQDRVNCLTKLFRQKRLSQYYPLGERRRQTGGRVSARENIGQPSAFNDFGNWQDAAAVNVNVENGQFEPSGLCQWHRLFNGAGLGNHTMT